MTETVYNIYEAKAHLSALLQRAEKGEEIVIAKAGKPLWKIVSLPNRKPKRFPGLLKGKIWYADDAFSPEVDAEIAAEFEKSDIIPSEKKR